MQLSSVTSKGLNALTAHPDHGRASEASEADDLFA
jgi:hypothetical protein